MAERILRQQNCTWRPQVTLGSSVAEVRAQLRENKQLRALTKWFWMILCQLWLSVTKPLLALIPPSRRKCVTQKSTSVHRAGPLCTKTHISPAGLTVGQAIMQSDDAPQVSPSR